MPISAENKLRCLINQSSLPKDDMVQFLQQNPGCFYLGIDPTALTLHLGHLVVLKLAQCLMEYCNWKCIILVGGFTAQIGDPTGKDKARQTLQLSTISRFASGILSDVQRVMRPYNVTHVNNEEWLGALSLREYMEYAKHISVNRKINQDTYKSRIENNKPLTMQEFMYSDLQAIDFKYLNEKYHCTLQIGGSDQWANMAMGLSITNDCHCITTPLLTVKGAKMGKTTQNAVGIFDDYLNLLHTLYHFPTATKQQLQLLFQTEQYDYVGGILKMLYHDDHIVNNYIQDYLNQQNCTDVNDAHEQWWTHIAEIKLSNIISTLYDCSKEHAKQLIEQHACLVDGIVADSNYRLEPGRYIIQVANMIKKYVHIHI
jgi:tyrosyl-tRNA synthetase